MRLKRTKCKETAKADSVDSVCLFSFFENYVVKWLRSSFVLVGGCRFASKQFCVHFYCIQIRTDSCLSNVVYSICIVFYVVLFAGCD